MSKTRRSEAERRREAMEQSLTGLGNLIYEQITNHEFPWIHMQSRSTDNIMYDPEERQYVLGPRMIRRHSRNIRHIRPFTPVSYTHLTLPTTPYV